MNHTKPGSTFTELILETFRLNGALIEAGDKLISDLGLTSARWQVLGALVGGANTVAEIARQMGLSRQNVQRIANRLQKDGFLDVGPNPAHRRAKLYFLTPQGFEAMQEVTRRQEEWINTLSEGMEAKALQETLEVMSDCRERVQKSTQGAADDET